MLKTKWICLQCDTVNDDKDNECDVCEGKTPIINIFEALPKAISIGDSTFIKWNIEYADDIEIEGIGKVGMVGEKEFNLEKNTSFKLKVRNEVSERELNISVKLPSPKITDFATNNPDVNLSEGNKLTWSASNYKNLIISPSIYDVTNKKELVVFPNKTTTYKLEATNSTGKAVSTLTLNLPAPKIVSFKSSSIEIKEKEDLFLSWSIENAESIHISPEIGDVSHIKDSKTLISPKSTTRYTITAKNSTGEIKEILTLRLKPPIINFFSTSKSIVIPDSDVELKWSVENANEVEIEGYGIVEPEGTTIISLLEDTELHIKATGDYGVIEERKQLIKVAKVVEFDVYGFLDEKYKLGWKCKNLDHIKILPLLGEFPIEGEKVITPSDTFIEYNIIGTTKYGDKVKQLLHLETCKLSIFEIDSKHVYMGRKVNLRWKVENAQKVIINNGIGEVELIGNTSIVINGKHSDFKLTAFGKINSAVQIIDLFFIDIPKIKIIRVSEPSVKISIDSTNIKLPEISNFIKARIDGGKLSAKIGRLSTPDKKIVHISKRQSNNNFTSKSTKSLLVNLRNVLLKKASDE